MQDKSVTNLFIMGPSEEVKKVKVALSDERDCFNPFRVYACEDIIKQHRSFIVPGNGECIEDFKKRMLSHFQELAFSDTTGRLYRCHYGLAMNLADFPGISMLDKEICYFTRTGSPPIQEFVTISNYFTRVAFSMQFDSSWLTHVGTVFILRGAVCYSNYRIHHKDLSGYNIMLDENFDFHYKSKHLKTGMIVPPHKIQGIERTFIPEEPENMRCMLAFFPHYYRERETGEEEIYDDYNPVIYEPSQKEIRKYWDETLAEIISIDRYKFFNPKPIFIND